MEITPYKNGVHSLAEGLRQLNSFLSEESDPFKMKEVVIKIHHGLETLFKDILFQRNPIFLLDEKTTVKQVLECYQGFFEGKNNYLFDEAKSITPAEAVRRIKSLHIGDAIAPKDFAQLTESFDKLNSLRNQLQHFALKANPDEIVRILGNLVPRSIALLKACYSLDLADSYLSRMQAVPHKPLIGMVKLFSNEVSLDSDLNAIYPEATVIISQLESRYDVLLHQAIRKFSKAKFPNQQLEVRISDHGRVGASPYMPSISVKGWINEELEPHKNAVDSSWGRLDEISASYSSSLKIGRPIVKFRGSDNWNDDTVSELSIECESKILVHSSEGFFSIPETEDYISFVKKPEISLKMNLTCEISGLFNESHFHIGSVRSLSGSLQVEMTSIIFGDKKEEPSIFGRQSILLDKDNTAISLHAFVGSNGRLKDNYVLEINVDAAAEIAFK